MSKKLLLLFVVSAAMAAWPTVASAGTFKGIVVGSIGGSVLVAAPSGSVHTFAGHAFLGSRVMMSGRRLTVIGRAKTAHIRGIVIRRIGATMFLLSNMHLVAVHAARRLASANDTPSTASAPVGDLVNTQVTISDDGQLDDDQEDDIGPASANTLPVQAVVASVGAGTITLTVAGQALTISLPAGLTLPSSLVGQTITLSLSLGGRNGQEDQAENEDNTSNDGHSTTSGDTRDDGGGVDH